MNREVGVNAERNDALVAPIRHRQGRPQAVSRKHFVARIR